MLLYLFIFEYNYLLSISYFVIKIMFILESKFAFCCKPVLLSNYFNYVFGYVILLLKYKVISGHLKYKKANIYLFTVQ